MHGRAQIFTPKTVLKKTKTSTSHISVLFITSLAAVIIRSSGLLVTISKVNFSPTKVSENFISWCVNKNRGPVKWPPLPLRESRIVWWDESNIIMRADIPFRNPSVPVINVRWLLFVRIDNRFVGILRDLLQDRSGHIDFLPEGVVSSCRRLMERV